jgi:hypothetical protein
LKVLRFYDLTCNGYGTERGQCGENWTSRRFEDDLFTGRAALEIIRAIVQASWKESIAKEGER